MNDAELPQFVRGADGRVVPFEPERIARAIFAATELHGSPNAFLARELTEGVLHFLAAESNRETVTSDEIGDVVGKVVRELGHPELARAYEERSTTPQHGPNRPALDNPPWPEWLRSTNSPARVAHDAAAGALTDFSLEHVFSRDVAHAHSEGLIALNGLENPLELAAVVANVPSGGVFEAIASARRVCGGFIAIDGPEFDLEFIDGDVSSVVERYLHDLRAAADAYGVQLVLNLNSRFTPPRHRDGGGPLFASDVRTSSRRQELARQLATQAQNSSLSIWWHVDAKGQESIPQPLAKPDSRIEFVFDRVSAEIQLGPGLDRRTPATLLQVGVNLWRLVELLGGPPVDSSGLLTKVASLTRFAKTAAHAKQDFLRLHGRPELREAFLLDRARLVLIPLGLAETSRSTDRPANELARDILRTMREAAENDRPRRMPVQVDALLDDSVWAAGAEVDRPWRNRLRSAAALHSVVGGGCFTIDLNDRTGDRVDVESVLEAAAQSAVCRLRFT